MGASDRRVGAREPGAEAGQRDPEGGGRCIVDALNRRIVRWRVSPSLHVELVLDALEMVIWARQGDTEPHSCRGGFSA
jgi:transposase InsO family protein